MKPLLRNPLTVPVLLVLVLLSIVYTAGIQEKHYPNEYKSNEGLREQQVVINGTPLHVEVAETPEQRSKGLSNRTKPLKEGKGMLFVFKEDGKHHIWMKDTHFPLDILWITHNKHIIHIEESVQPNTYKNERDYKVFTSQTPARYVLELPAGYVQKQAIKVGDTVEW